ncbi:hypothetical protein F5Y12DRAFT_792364 [Xylaria sp. FL1777]|nr:hypothetical protein F5Y12DRAFT_792364 [Xylaria sp. FL1777]
MALGNPTLKFIRDLPLYEREKPYNLSYGTYNDGVATNVQNETKEVHLTDIRGQENKFSYADNSFRFVTLPPHTTLDGTEQAAIQYLEEIRQFLVSEFQADRVIIYDIRQRTSSPAERGGQSDHLKPGSAGDLMGWLSNELPSRPLSLLSDLGIAPLTTFSHVDFRTAFQDIEQSSLQRLEGVDRRRVESVSEYEVFLNKYGLLKEFLQAVPSAVSFVGAIPEILRDFERFMQGAFNSQRAKSLAPEFSTQDDGGRAVLARLCELIGALTAKMHMLSMLQRTESLEATLSRFYESFLSFLVQAILSIRMRIPDNVKNGSLPEVETKFHTAMARLEDTLSILEQLNRLHPSVVAHSPPSLSGPHVSYGVMSPSSTSFFAEPTPFGGSHTVVLPAQNIRFYGRTDIINQIHDELMFFEAPGTIKTTVLHGLGGVGKTEIARAYAYHVKDSCDVIFWVSCESSMSLQEGFTAAALRLQLSGADAHEHRKNINLVLNWLGTTGQRWLLILNNVDDPGILKGNIPTVGQGSIIVTARNAQPFFELTSSLIRINPFSVEEGSECLISLTGRRGFDEVEELAAAKALTIKLGGHALGISQVAALIRSRGISIKTGDNLYEKNQRRLHSFRARQTFDSSFEHDLTTLWSLQFESLHREAEKLLGIIMFLSPDDISTKLFDLTLAEDEIKLPDELQFLEDSLAYWEAEAQLLDLSLAQKTFGTGQLSIHRLVQFEFGYFLEKQDPQQRQLAFEYAAKLLCQAFPKQIKGRPMYLVWSTCQQYYSHIISLGKHYMNSSPGLKKLRPTREFCEAISNCAWYLRERGAAEVNDLLLAGLNACREIRGPKELELIYAHILNTVGAQQDDLGHSKFAIPYFLECLEIRRKYLDPADEELSGVLHNISLNHLNLKQYTQCLDFRQQSVDSINLMPPSKAKANKLAKRKYVLARCLFSQKHYVEAHRQLDETLQELLTVGDWFNVVLTYNALGNLKFAIGDYAAAERYFETSMQTIVERLPASESRGKLGTLCFQAKLAIQLGQGEKAVRLLRSLMALMDTTAKFETQRARGYWMMSCAFQMLTDEEKERVGHGYEYKNEILDAGKLNDMAIEILRRLYPDADWSHGITNETFVGLVYDTFV